jgi:transposase
LNVIRQRLPEDVFDRVFQFVLGLLHEQGPLRGRTLGIDATTLKANAAMKSIVCMDTYAGWAT